MNYTKLISFVTLLLIINASWAEDAQLNKNVPARYVVQAGDTLWGISAKYLKNPWMWKKLWQENPQLKRFGNPNKIYPGDVLHLSYNAFGEPILSLSDQLNYNRLPKDGYSGTRSIIKSNGDVKLSPTLRISAIEKAIPTIPLDAIRQFLVTPKTTDVGTYKDSPYVVAYEGQHIIGGVGNNIYVRGLDASHKAQTRFNIFRKSKTYTHEIQNDDSWFCQYRYPQEANNLIGYGLTHVGIVTLEKPGKIALMSILKSSREILAGDRVFSIPEQLISQNFYPKKPETDYEGMVIDVYDAVNQIGQFQVAILNGGSDEGFKEGDVVNIFAPGRTIKDRFTEKRIDFKSAPQTWKKQMQLDAFTLPDEQSGVAMIFRTQKHLSYALIVHSKNYAVHIHDKFQSP